MTSGRTGGRVGTTYRWVWSPNSARAGLGECAAGDFEGFWAGGEAFVDRSEVLQAPDARNEDLGRRMDDAASDCLTAFSFARPDPLTLASALGMLTTKIKFMVAVRNYLENCVTDALQFGSLEEQAKAYDDLMDVIYKYRV